MIRFLTRAFDFGGIESFRFGAVDHLDAGLGASPLLIHLTTNGSLYQHIHILR